MHTEINHGDKARNERNQIYRLVKDDKIAILNFPFIFLPSRYVDILRNMVFSTHKKKVFLTHVYFRNETW
jgi:hypothetical protein